jgi:phage shock protein E
MSVKQVNPKQTYEILQKDANSVYIDVRTEQEFQNGHVPGAVNIPVMLPDPATRRMTPSPDFLPNVQAKFAKDKKIILGCQMGGRSQFAGEILDQAGYGDVSNMQGGFGGAKDPMGRLVAPGWLQSDLPVER